MRTITVLHRQTFLDIAMQHAGSAEEAFAIAARAGVSVTEQLEAGTVLPAPLVVYPDIVEFLRVERAAPATGDEYTSEGEAEEGIDFWAIEEDFIVS